MQKMELNMEFFTPGVFLFLMWGGVVAFWGWLVFFGPLSDHKPTCQEWDLILNKLIDEHKIVDISCRVIYFDNGIGVSLLSSKYATPDIAGGNEIIPKRKTKKKLKRLVTRSLVYGINQKMKEVN